MKKWILATPPAPDFLSAHPELPPLAVRLLWNRGLRTQEQIDEFLNPDYLGDIHDPYLFKDMNKAVELIFAAIKNNDRIVVHGDYDADGVCASAIIISTLKKLGMENVGVFIPHREIDGYGLNNNTVDYLKKDGAKLVITCDCGISNTKEIEYAKNQGMKVIVTDHHAMPAVFPPADAIIHPLVPGETYPDRTLSGGGVAFKLIQGLLKTHAKDHELLPDGERHEAFEKWLLDMVAISTVADMVPLVGESRTLTRYGLTVLNKSRNLGLRALLTVAGLMDENGKGKKIFDTETISFQLAPRINAAGRMDHANVAFALLMAKTHSEAKELAEQLQKNNTDRQKLTEQLLKESRKQITETKQENEPMIFVEGKNWSAGILGLVASKLKDEYYKPILVMGVSDKMVVGSGRSIAGFNIIANLQALGKHLTKFGGHPQACGFSLDPKNLESFKKDMLEKAASGTKDLDLTPQLKIDAEVDLEEVNWKLFDILQKFEPFGTANDEPRYAARNLSIAAIEPVGKDNKHLRIMVKHNSHLVRKTIAFGFGDAEKHPANWSETLRPGDKIDLAFSVSVNEWNGNRELQLMVDDIKKTS